MARRKPLVLGSDGRAQQVQAGDTVDASADDYNGLTAADPAYADQLAGYGASATAARKFQVDRLLGLQPAIPGGRLTLTSGSPCPTVDVSNAASVYYTPYASNRITLWDGTRWVAVTFAELTLALGTLTSGNSYDVFAYLSSGAAALELNAWAASTARTSDLQILDGRYCKNADKTRLYLGTFFTTSILSTEDSVQNRYLWNLYHRVPKAMYRQDGTDSWNYTTATLRSANNSTSNRLNFVRGLDLDPVFIRVLALAQNTTPSCVGAVDIGIDSTTAGSAQIKGARNVTSLATPVTAEYMGYPGKGQHYAQWLEWSQAAGTTTWYGDQGLTVMQTGIYGWGVF